MPARSFQHLLTIDLQRQALEAFHRHLEPTGRLVLHVFDPRLDLLIDPNIKQPELSGMHPETGRRYPGEVLRTRFDHLNQLRRDLWRYTEIGPNGEVLAQDTREMALRWTYRWELYHLLRLCGLAVEAEYSDFGCGAPTYGKESWSRALHKFRNVSSWPFTPFSQYGPLRRCMGARRARDPSRRPFGRVPRLTKF